MENITNPPEAVLVYFEKRLNQIARVVLVGLGWEASSDWAGLPR